MTSVERVLLLDCLDSTGSDLADARDRVAMLRAAVPHLTTLVIGSNLDPAAKGLGRGTRLTEPGPAALAEVRSLIATSHPDLVIVASAEPGGGSVARALPATGPALWWPTGVAGPDPAGWWSRLARIRKARALPSFLESASGEGYEPVPSLAGSCVAPPTSRRASLPLWDGETVLMPEGLESRGGELALAAFAALAEEWSELDLVAWSHPRADDEARVRGLGVEARIHHVGPPPRMAEWAWFSQARVVILTGRAALSGGLALRALSAGCPLLFVGGSASATRLGHELMARGCAWHVVADAGVVMPELSRLLDHGPDVAAAVEQGRILAAHHDPSILAARVMAGLSPAPSRAAAA